jgi:hypothetical protein
LIKGTDDKGAGLIKGIMMDKIGNTLILVRDKLNQFIGDAFAEGESQDLVILSNITKPGGEHYALATNKVVMLLANICSETTISTYNKNVPVSNDQYAVMAAPLYINLYLLVFANFSDELYHKGLETISGTLDFFQQNPSFTQANLPGLNPKIGKLTFEMVNLELSELSYLFGLMGCQYLPAVYYKVRMIPFTGEQVQAQTPPVQGVKEGA